ncbi:MULTISPECIES: hypothetical protein [Kitasatospora]|uniref:hypothetical protein n=1 Tax=Kitasatospora TaxID=2063 RepID=UPI000C710FC7|nr:hypothetical protein [Kitasatospora sp. GP30]MDH6140963.1 hypothetical protein [Kitasatospora sp. GP30]
MALRFSGMDPETQGNGSPTVWVDDEELELVIQGRKPDAGLLARISTTEWVPGHATGIPEDEVVARIPLRMAAIVRKALDDAERSGLL